MISQVLFHMIHEKWIHANLQAIRDRPRSENTRGFPRTGLFLWSTSRFHW